MFKAVKEASLLQCIADEIVRVPWRFNKVGFFAAINGFHYAEDVKYRRVSSQQYNDGSPFLGALLQPSRWERFWIALAKACDVMSKYESRSALKSILDVIRNKKDSVASIPPDAAAKICSKLDLFKQLDSGDLDFISWLIPILYGSIQDFVRNTMTAFRARVRRTKGSNLVGMNGKMMEKALVAMLLIEGKEEDEQRFRDDFKYVVDVLQGDVVKRIGALLLKSVGRSLTAFNQLMPPPFVFTS